MAHRAVAMQAGANDVIDYGLCNGHVSGLCIELSGEAREGGGRGCVFPLVIT